MACKISRLTAKHFNNLRTQQPLFSPQDLAETPIAFIFIERHNLTQSMNPTDQFAAQLTHLQTATQTLKSLLTDDRHPTTFTETCKEIALIATDLTAIGPIDPKPAGLYAVWLEITLALGEAKTRNLTAMPLEALDGAIAAVRIMRRTFGIAPGGA
jgi:hypothetical protein